ncbi:hypothetical protein SUDANB15_06154 [Streptomyces sp. enrichment culture]
MRHPPRSVLLATPAHGGALRHAPFRGRRRDGGDPARRHHPHPGRGAGALPWDPTPSALPENSPGGATGPSRTGSRRHSHPYGTGPRGHPRGLEGQLPYG